MVSLKNALLVALVAAVQATPLGTVKTVISRAEDLDPDTGLFPRPDLPEGAIDISHNATLIAQLKEEYGLEVPSEAPAPVSGGISIMSGACDQGTCPDYKKAWDLINTHIAITTPGPGGAPPTTVFWDTQDMRVNDCGKCHRGQVSSGSIFIGGCWSFTSCNRAQTICLDGSKNRAHRQYKDNGHKNCYRTTGVGLGSCGHIKWRAVYHAAQSVACNW